MSLTNEYERIPMGKGLIIETNFSEASTPCKLFRVSVRKESSIITREELFGLLFLFADENQQEDLIPVIETKMRSISRLLTFTLKKDMRKGERVKAWYQYFVPETVYEKLLIKDPERYREATKTLADAQR